MTTGRLWLCDKKETLLKNIQQAAEFYQKKFGKPAQLCLVHPGLLNNVILPVGEITVRPYSNIPAEHIWIGREDETILEQAIGVAQ